MTNKHSEEKVVQIIPSILAVTEEEYKTKVQELESNSDLAEGWVQIDFMDNKFVQNQSISLDTVLTYKLNLKKEAHLMVVDPENWINNLAKVGFKRIIFHEEANADKTLIEKIKKLGMQVGVALNPETPVAKLLPFIDTIDIVLLMSVHPGFGGQQFIPETFEKIKQVAKLKGDFLIEVDGGITPEISKQVVDAGADNLVIGEYLENGNITENLESIWESISY